MSIYPEKIKFKWNLNRKMSSENFPITVHYSRLKIKIKDGKNHLISVAYGDLPPNVDGAEAAVECPDMIQAAKTPLKPYGNDC